jgi:hypothetical protein
MDTSDGGTGDGRARQLLASDAERETTVEQLRVACADGRLTIDELHERSDQAYRARTGAELAQLTSDLPAGGVAAATGITVGPDGSDSGEDVDSYVAVFSGSERKGHWRVPRRSRAVAVFGGVHLDMAEADFASRDIFVNAVAVFGGIEVDVPPGVEVRMTGFAVFGGKSCNVPPRQPGAPVLHVRCSVVFGGIEVKAKQRLLDEGTAVRHWLSKSGRQDPQLPG